MVGNQPKGYLQNKKERNLKFCILKVYFGIPNLRPPLTRKTPIPTVSRGNPDNQMFFPGNNSFSQKIT